MDDVPAPPLVADLQLAAGLRVVGRGHDHLQIGLYDGRRVLLPRTGAVEATLDALLARRPIEHDETTTPILDQLQTHGCVSRRDDDLARERRRRAARVLVLGSCTGVDATALLASAGVRASAVAEPEIIEHADVVLALSTGEIARDRLDPLIRQNTSHVVVRLVDGAALVGPFVAPGVTACLRCIDAHESIQDPDHVAVTNRYVRATSRARADGVPDVADPVLATLAVAWAVRDVVAHLDGRRPSTWSRTLFLGPEPSHRHEQDWSRHPECGCSWPADDPLSGTMGV